MTDDGSLSSFLPPEAVEGGLNTVPWSVPAFLAARVTVGRTVRRIRSTTFVRAAETVRRPGRRPRSFGEVSGRPCPTQSTNECRKACPFMAAVPAEAVWGAEEQRSGNPAGRVGSATTERKTAQGHASAAQPLEYRGWTETHAVRGGMGQAHPRSTLGQPLGVVVEATSRASRADVSGTRCSGCPLLLDAMGQSNG